VDCQRREEPILSVHFLLLSHNRDSYEYMPPIINEHDNKLQNKLIEDKKKQMHIALSPWLKITTISKALKNHENPKMIYEYNLLWSSLV
jgi:hypothetical protein